MDYDKMLEQIKQVLREEDLMSLLKMGAPLDEYDSEALMIFERSYRFDTVDTLKDKLWDVFYMQFCYGTVYKMIDGEMKEICKEVVPREEADKQIGLKHKYSDAATKILKIINP